MYHVGLLGKEGKREVREGSCLGSGEGGQGGVKKSEKGAK